MRFNSRLMTNTLLLYILAFLVYHFERPMFWNLLIFVGAMWLISWAFRFPAKFKGDRAKAKQEKADNDEFFNIYIPARDAIRKKYDPNHEWNEATTVPQACQNEQRELRLKHRWMLQRRNNYKFDD
jgi:hypothetical protein